MHRTKLAHGEAGIFGSVVGIGLVGRIQDFTPFRAEMASEITLQLLLSKIAGNRKPDPVEVAHGNPPARGDSPDFIKIDPPSGLRSLTDGGTETGKSFFLHRSKNDKGVLCSNISTSNPGLFKGEKKGLFIFPEVFIESGPPVLDDESRVIQGEHRLEETEFTVQTFEYRPVLSPSKHQGNVPAHTEGYLMTQGLHDEGLCGGKERGIVIEIVISAVLRESKRGHRSKKEIPEELCRAAEPLGKGIDKHAGGFPLLREIILNTA